MHWENPEKVSGARFFWACLDSCALTWLDCSLARLHALACACMRLHAVVHWLFLGSRLPGADRSLLSRVGLGMADASRICQAVSSGRANCHSPRPVWLSPLSGACCVGVASERQPQPGFLDVRPALPACCWQSDALELAWAWDLQPKGFEFQAAASLRSDVVESCFSCASATFIRAVRIPMHLRRV